MAKLKIANSDAYLKYHSFDHIKACSHENATEFSSVEEATEKYAGYLKTQFLNLVLYRPKQLSFLTHQNQIRVEENGVESALGEIDTGQFVELLTDVHEGTIHPQYDQNVDGGIFLTLGFPWTRKEDVMCHVPESTLIFPTIHDFFGNERHNRFYAKFPNEESCLLFLMALETDYLVKVVQKKSDIDEEVAWVQSHFLS